MTTIVFTRDNVYCDTQITAGNEITSKSAIKFMPLSNGKIALGAGSVSGIMAAVAAYEGVANELIETYFSQGNATTLLILSPDGFIDRYKTPRNRQLKTAEGARANNKVMFWTGTSDFSCVGSGSPHVSNYFDFIGKDPKEAMMFAASKDTATCEYFFELPRRWDKDKPLIAKLYHGRRNNKMFKKPHEIVVPFPEKSEWIMDALCGKRPVYEIDISEFVK